MTRETPICHRTIGPDVPVVLRDTRERFNERIEWTHHSPRPCIGSKCAMWAPDDIDPGVPTGLGSCSDNRRDHYPWPDPAAKGAP